MVAAAYQIHSQKLSTSCHGHSSLKWMLGIMYNLLNTTIDLRAYLGVIIVNN